MTRTDDAFKRICQITAGQRTLLASASEKIHSLAKRTGNPALVHLSQALHEQKHVAYWAYARLQAQTAAEAEYAAAEGQYHAQNRNRELAAGRSAEARRLG